jgi:hypothetical protein
VLWFVIFCCKYGYYTCKGSFHLCSALLRLYRLNVLNVLMHARDGMLWGQLWRMLDTCLRCAGLILSAVSWFPSIARIASCDNHNTLLCYLMRSCGSSCRFILCLVTDHFRKAAGSTPHEMIQFSPMRLTHLAAAWGPSFWASKTNEHQKIFRKILLGDKTRATSMADNLIVNYGSIAQSAGASTSHNSIGLQSLLTGTVLFVYLSALYSLAVICPSLFV